MFFTDPISFKRFLDDSAHPINDGCGMFILVMIKYVFVLCFKEICINHAQKEIARVYNVVDWREIKNNVKTVDMQLGGVNVPYTNGMKPSLLEEVLFSAESFSFENERLTNKYASFFTGAPFHGSSNDFEFGIELNNTSLLHRNTEYCQWEKGTDGYPDHLGWRPNLIGNYEKNLNFQRDPYPSEVFASENAVIGNVRVGRDYLRISMKDQARRIIWSSDLVKREKAKKWGGSWFSWFVDNSRYELTEQLFESTYSRSEAYLLHKFSYVGDGYFLSQYNDKSSQSYTSFFNFMGSERTDCTAGDIRVYYTVNDHSLVSGVGEVLGLAANSDLKVLTTYTSTKNLTYGILLEGSLPFNTLLDREYYNLWKETFSDAFLSIFLIFIVYTIVYPVILSKIVQIWICSQIWPTNPNLDCSWRLSCWTFDCQSGLIRFLFNLLCLYGVVVTSVQMNTYNELQVLNGPDGIRVLICFTISLTTALMNEYQHIARFASIYKKSL